MTLINEKPIDIVDIKKKYHLKMLQKRHNILGTIWSLMSGITTLFIPIIVGWFIYKKCLKKSRRHETNTFCHYDNIREQINLSINDPTISSTTTATTVENDNGTQFSVKSALTPES